MYRVIIAIFWAMVAFGMFWGFVFGHLHVVGFIECLIRQDFSSDPGYLMSIVAILTVLLDIFAFLAFILGMHCRIFLWCRS
ncbi:MAG: hypothetical protein ABIH67_04775 [Candidatus Uhrbacteria bacterium]